jgi:hypothetical protein
MENLSYELRHQSFKEGQTFCSSCRGALGNLHSPSVNEFHVVFCFLRCYLMRNATHVALSIVTLNYRG